MVTLDPRDPRAVAKWALKAAYDAHAPRALWLRVVNGGPGWWCAHPDEPPRGGCGWQRVVTVATEDAARAMGHSAGAGAAYLVVLRVREQVEAALSVAG